MIRVSIDRISPPPNATIVRGRHSVGAPKLARKEIGIREPAIVANFGDRRFTETQHFGGPGEAHLFEQRVGRESQRLPKETIKISFRHGSGIGQRIHVDFLAEVQLNVFHRLGHAPIGFKGSAALLGVTSR